MKITMRYQRELWGAHAPLRAGFGALAETIFGKVRDREGAIARTRGACALRNLPHHFN